LAEGFSVGVTLVREAVAEWRRNRREVFVPLVYHPGDLAEVDFFEVLVDVAGARQKAWMLVVRLMHSGRDYARIYPRQDQVCFLAGHVRAFAHFGRSHSDSPTTIFEPRWRRSWSVPSAS
jgi:transposase